MSSKLAKQDYVSLLDTILRTNPKKKAEKLMEKATGVKTPSEEHTEPSECSLSQVLKFNQLCINHIQIARDNLLRTYMCVKDSTRKQKEKITQQLTEMVENLINLVSEGVSLSRKINGNAMGLHLAVDFLRNMDDLKILDFSREGPIPLSHFSCNEATTMCLTWLHTSAENVAKGIVNAQEAVPISDSLVKVYLAFTEAICNLKNSSQLATQVFRVLLYCSTQGKEMLRNYLKNLMPQEINDIITELQMLRRQFDEINNTLEKLGWSLADIWTRFTGNEISFEGIQLDGLKSMSSQEKSKSLVAKESVPSVKELKTKDKLKSKPIQPKSKFFGGESRKLVILSKANASVANPNPTTVKKTSKVNTKKVKKTPNYYSKLEEVLGRKKEVIQDSSPSDSSVVKVGPSPSQKTLQAATSATSSNGKELAKIPATQVTQTKSISKIGKNGTKPVQKGKRKTLGQGCQP